MTGSGTPVGQAVPASAGEPAAPAAAPASLVRQVAGLVFDIAAPIALYYGLRAAGLPSLQALAIGAVIPAASAAWVLIRRRRANMVALLVLGTIVASLIISVISHSPRFLLAKDGLLTSVWGIWFLASLRARRPAAFLFARPLLEGRRAFAVRDWDLLWDTEPRFRRIWRVSTVIWGLALLADAVIRVVMSYTLPVDVVPGLGGALYPVTFVVIQIVTNVYYQVAGLNRLLGARWLGDRGSARQHVRVQRAGRVERRADPGEQRPLGG
jgi:hypothetical protein